MNCINSQKADISISFSHLLLTVLEGNHACAVAALGKDGTIVRAAREHTAGPRSLVRALRVFYLI